MQQHLKDYFQKICKIIEKMTISPFLSSFWLKILDQAPGKTPHSFDL